MRDRYEPVNAVWYRAHQATPSGRASLRGGCSSESSGLTLTFEKCEDIALSNWSFHVSHQASSGVVYEHDFHLCNTSSRSYITLTVTTCCLRSKISYQFCRWSAEQKRMWFPSYPYCAGAWDRLYIINNCFNNYRVLNIKIKDIFFLHCKNFLILKDLFERIPKVCEILF